MNLSHRRSIPHSISFLLAIVLLFSNCTESGGQSGTSAGGSGTASGTYTEGTDYVVLERVRFLDRMGFDRPVEAFSLLFPRGWKTEGGVKWRGIQECRSDLVSNYVKASSPDGSMQLEIYPSRTFQWADDQMMLQGLRAGVQQGGCEVNQPFTAEEYLTGLAQQDLGATASNIHRDEGRTQHFQKLDQESNEIARRYGNNMEQNSVVAFGDLTWPDGTRGIAHVLVVNIVMRMQNYLTGGTDMVTSTSVPYLAVIRFPAGRREEASRLYGTVNASVRTNPVWQQAKTNFLTQLGNIEHAGRMERIRLQGEASKAYAQAQSEASDQRMRSWENQQASQDRQHKAFVQTIREVETWKDASGSAVEMSAGYDQAWSRGDGTYILSNKPGFDPSAVFQDQQWTEMKRAD